MVTKARTLSCGALCDNIVRSAVRLAPASGVAFAQVTTTDQATGAVGQEPLKTLKSFRTGKLLDWVPEPSWRHEVYFGWHMARGPAGRRRRSLS